MPRLAIQSPDTRIMELLEAEFSSLCNSCDHFNACAYQDFAKPVIHCELFENETGPFTHVASKDTEIGDASPPVGVKGICVNCDKVWGCKLPKAPAGVWHCEEYE